MLVLVALLLLVQSNVAADEYEVYPTYVYYNPGFVGRGGDYHPPFWWYYYPGYYYNDVFVDQGYWVRYPQHKVVKE